MFTSANVSPVSGNSSNSSPCSPTVSNDGQLNPQTLDSVMFAKLSGRQELRLKLKQNDAINGPKVINTLYSM